MPTLYEHAMDQPLSYEILDALLDLPVMQIGGKEVKSGKVGGFFGLPDVHGGMPYFRCPSFHSCALMPTWMQGYFQSFLNQGYNLIKVQKYENGKSGIGLHADKALDMVPGSDIWIYRINRQVAKTRSLIFVSKQNTGGMAYPIPHNAKLRITAEENKSLLHYVPPYEEEATDCCYSFVIRKIGTFQLDTMVYGIGAKYPTWEERVEAVVEEDGATEEDMHQRTIEMYHFENTHDLTVTDPEPVYASVRKITF